MTWTPDMIGILREYWGDKTARQIGELVDKSRNAVLGKAYRLGLSESLIVSEKELNNRQRNSLRERSSRPSRRPANSNSTDGCQWLHGEPRDRDFCGAPKRPGSSYCEAHHKRCWIRPENYRSEAA